jgi:hypothetical protein
MLLRIIVFILMLGLATTIIVATSIRDNQIAVRYDCRMLIGGWHPDFSKEMMDACRKKGYKSANS